MKIEKKRARGEFPGKKVKNAWGMCKRLKSVRKKGGFDLNKTNQQRRESPKAVEKVLGNSLKD